MVVLLAGACSAEPPVPAPVTTMPWRPPTLVNEQVPYERVLHVVRDVVDGRTVELADGRKVQIAQLAAPVGCWAEGALAFARTTLLASAVRISPVRSGDVRLELEDGTDYAVLAVRQGVVRAQGVDGGPLSTAESGTAANAQPLPTAGSESAANAQVAPTAGSEAAANSRPLLIAQAEAAAAGRGVWGPPCDTSTPATPGLADPGHLNPGHPDLGQPTPRQPTPGQPAPGNTSGTTTKAPAPTNARPPAPPSQACVVAYRVTGQWPGGFQASVSVRNTGSSSVDGWTLRWTFANGQSVTDMWNARARQSGAVVNALNADYNPHIAPGGEVVIGFNGATRAGNSAPGAFTLNGLPCGAG
ncbi:cellulose binding domain-containing protein [Lentzea sp. CA-135723]|uniref:cellulose binding domain-containing protein n=1 Tax=Lentzea sp. CA-135723 TaxID=3239950 RepID=UPI003D93D0F8